ncbi:hypothetical protein [Bradyrhizobium sp. USDA 4502]
MLTGRAMYIWELQPSLKGGTVAQLVAKAQSAKLSSLWVKIGDGASPFANIQDANIAILHDLVAQCSATNIVVLGYHVPHCPTAASVQGEVTLCANAVDTFGLAGIVVDNEDGAGFFTGNAQTAAAYGQALQAAMRARSKIVVMSSNDILSAHPNSYGSVIGQHIDLNGPQVYYGRSPTVQNRLGRAISSNAGINAPFFPVGAAFVSPVAAGDGGCASDTDCAQRAAQFIDLVSQLHHGNPNKYPGYGFWDWQEAPDEFWEVLSSTEVFTGAEVAAAGVEVLARQNPAPALQGILQTLGQRANAVAYEGVSSRDLNLPGNMLLVVSADEFYSFQASDIVDQEALGGSRVRLWVRRGARAWQAGAIAIGGALRLRETVIGMEDLPEPPTVIVPGMPVQASDLHRQRLQALAPGASSIAAAAAAYNGACVGGDHYANNCAHFLSDAFIRSGTNELVAGQSADGYFHARCGTHAERPIRARDMWQWFQSKATTTSRALAHNTGIWAVFQLDESVYWGGHVVIVDTDAWAFHGTGCHWNWDQYAYKW